MHYPPWLALLTALTPLLVGAASSRLLHAPAAVARHLTIVSAVLALVLSAATALALSLSGETHTTSTLLMLDPNGLQATVSVYVDLLTCLMLLMVSVVGIAVSLFAERYLDGDRDQARFSQWLSFTHGAVLLLIVSGNLVVLWLAWVASSLGLHQLLTYYADRPVARLAAKKKFLISRLGDGLLLFGFLLLFLLFGSVEYSVIFEAARASEGTQPWLTLAAVFCVLGAMTKSAQLPLHTWLPDTMDTPTPVSAFMHAGIINAGGFLLIRLSPILVAAPRAMALLVVVGASTAAFASVVMLTQTDVKRKLAYSTVSQMGFMMLQIGLGAFSLAVLHIVGHSFYKAHAFLSASSSVQVGGPHAPARSASVPTVLATVLLCAGLVFGAALALGVELSTKPKALVLLGVLTLAAAQITLAGGGLRGGRAGGYAAGLLAAALVAGVYFGLGAGAEALLGDVVAVAPSAMGLGLGLFALSLFTAAFVVQLRPRGLTRSAFAPRAYLFIRHGFYLGLLQDRFVQRLWPDLQGDDA